MASIKRQIKRYKTAQENIDRIHMGKSFPLICRHFDDVLSDCFMFWSVPPHSRVGFSFGGNFRVPLGVWIIAWKEKLGVYDCPNCGSEKKAFALYASGAMTKGRTQGFCSACGRAWEKKEWSLNLWGFIQQEINAQLEATGNVEGKYPRAYAFEEAVEKLEELEKKSLSDSLGSIAP